MPYVMPYVTPHGLCNALCNALCNSSWTVLMTIANDFFISNVYFLMSGVPHKICFWRLPVLNSCKDGIDRCKYVDILGRVPFNKGNDTFVFI